MIKNYLVEVLILLSLMILLFLQNQADVNVLLLLLGVLCHALPLLSLYSEETAGTTTPANSILLLSRVSSIVLLVAYFGYLLFQLLTHQQLFDSGEVILILQFVLDIVLFVCKFVSF